MKGFLATTILVTGAMLAAGCASKKYVRNTTAPIQAKVDQVGEQTTQNSTQIQDTRTSVKQVDERAQSGISAAQERAATADQHAGAAMNTATAAGQKADQNAQGLSSLRNVVSNIDDYKLQTSTTVPFPVQTATPSLPRTDPRWTDWPMRLKPTSVISSPSKVIRIMSGLANTTSN